MEDSHCNEVTFEQVRDLKNQEASHAAMLERSSVDARVGVGGSGNGDSKGGKNELAVSQVQPGSHSLLLDDSKRRKWKMRPKTGQRQMS